MRSMCALVSALPSVCSAAAASGAESGETKKAEGSGALQTAAKDAPPRRSRSAASPLLCTTSAGRCSSSRPRWCRTACCSSGSRARARKGA